MCSPLSNESIPALRTILSGTFDVGSAEREDLHPGVDFFYPRLGDRSSIEGEEIQAMLPGTVVAAIQNRLPYGNMVIIETSQTSLPTQLIEYLGLHDGESLYSLYAHMQEPPRIPMGDTVVCGQVIGTVGKTGKDIAYAHLHLETRIGPAGSKFSGIAFYDTGATAEEMNNYVLWRTSGKFKPVNPMLIFSEYLSEENKAKATPAQ
jgi:murein DD-endopeptidase MepM/ murein hydrolase activator NlpD